MRTSEPIERTDLNATVVGFEGQRWGEALFPEKLLKAK